MNLFNLKIKYKYYLKLTQICFKNNKFINLKIKNKTYLKLTTKWFQNNKFI